MTSFFKYNPNERNYIDEEDYVQQIQRELKTMAKIAIQSSDNMKHDNKEAYDRNAHPRVFRVNELVLLKVEYTRRGRSEKMDDKFEGPWKVLAIDGVNITIKKGRNEQTVHSNRLKKYTQR